MKTTLGVEGKTYTVHFVELRNTSLTHFCSYCQERRGHPVELAITSIISSGGQDILQNEVIHLKVLKKLTETVIADKVVCEQAECRDRMRHDMDRAYRKAGVKEDDEPQVPA